MITRPLSRLVFGLLGALALSMAACARPAAGLGGRWEGIVVANKVEVPFQFELSEEGAVVEAAFFDGDLRVASTSGSRDGNTLRVAFAQYGTQIVATIAPDRLDGVYERGTRGAAYPFRAIRAESRPGPTDVTAPSVAGEWVIPHESSKGERAWRMIVRQTGGDVSAAILRIDGDTGTLTGTYRDGMFLLSHFSGARPMLLEVTPQSDGSLSLVQNRQTRLVAYRADDARARAVPAPSDPMAHTRAKDPTAVFAFSFPDLEGRIVSEQAFRGQVLLVNMTGSWCPNCHDEAPFLTELDETYRSQGLAVIAFAFEEADQLTHPERLRAFIRKFGISYPVLLAGLPEELAQKVPQAENLNAFPTTIFVGRDGRIRAIHAGFAGRATGAFHARGQDEIIAIVKQLLAEAPSRTN